MINAINSMNGDMNIIDNNSSHFAQVITSRYILQSVSQTPRHRKNIKNLSDNKKLFAH